MEPKVRIPNPCNENWNAMSPNEKGRFCNSCDKTVVDFTKMTNPEIQKYFTNNKAEGRICGHFKFDQVETKESIRYNNLKNRFDRIKVKPVRVLAMLSLGLFFSLSSCFMGKQAPVDGEADVNRSDTIKEVVPDTIKQADSLSNLIKVEQKK